MNILTKGIAALGLLIVATQSQATLITNGSFGTTGSCNLSGWEEYGDVSTNDVSGVCLAELKVNDFPDFEAELWQGLAFDADTDYVLTIDFNVDSTFLDNFFDDYLSISLINDDFDILELFSLNITGTDSFYESLAISADELTSYTNQGWSLSFYLYDEGGEFDENTSFVSINNVFIEEAPTDVPEPSSLAIFALGFAGLMSRRKLANELVRKSIKK
ncbi:PEP-CTERM sorting domain-containing protein [Colwellia demingiae]|uniref:PEP-CTERM sorting domain-containing protein n=1 Tax=Colwellia demingiae TaxID=89401 RepID=A0A5C6QES7_9GAMM|nr:PEP-CTERM sorting domain-containing protein [Colwellia demingiae]TWX67268.1 PEP-CTERM sorting domain-containing protein [Colwellia demingiae]